MAQLVVLCCARKDPGLIPDQGTSPGFGFDPFLVKVKEHGCNVILKVGAFWLEAGFKWPNLGQLEHQKKLQ